MDLMFSRRSSTNMTAVQMPIRRVLLPRRFVVSTFDGRIVNAVAAEPRWRVDALVGRGRRL